MMMRSTGTASERASKAYEMGHAAGQNLDSSMLDPVGHWNTLECDRVTVEAMGWTNDSAAASDISVTTSL